MSQTRCPGCNHEINVHYRNGCNYYSYDGICECEDTPQHIVNVELKALQSELRYTNGLNEAVVNENTALKAELARQSAVAEALKATAGRLEEYKMLYEEVEYKEHNGDVTIMRSLLWDSGDAEALELARAALAAEGE